MDEKEVLNDGRGTGEASPSGSNKSGSGSGKGRSGNNQNGNGANAPGNNQGSSTRNEGLDGRNAANGSKLEGDNGSSNTNRNTNDRGSQGNNGAGNPSGATPGNEAGNPETKLSEKPTILKPKDVKPSKAKAKSPATKESKNAGTLSDAEMIGTLIQTGGVLISGLTGRAHWNFTDEEAMTIANPAAAMLSKLTSAQKKQIEKFTAPAMLAAAIASVCIPKLIVDFSMMKGANRNDTVTKQVITVREPGNPTPNQEPRPQGGSVNAPAVGANVDPTIANLFESANQ